MSRGKRILLAVGGLAVAWILYEVFGTLVAYTDDAYVRSDLVAVAPLVTGRIIAVHIVDDQPIKTGDPLVTIDPEPFRLAVAQKTAEVEETTAEVAGDRDANRS